MGDQLISTVCVCGETGAEEVGSTAGLAVGVCRRCGMVRTLFRSVAYDDLYTTSEYHWGRPGQQPYDEREAHDYEVAGHRLPALLQRVRALDVGCANGGFVRRLADAGVSIEGFEPNAHMAALAARTSGRPVHTDWHTIRGSFDWVFYHDVLEHVPDPVAELIKVRGVLRPAGLVIIEIPDADHSAFDRGRCAEWRSWKHMKPREHLWHWGLRDITDVVSRAGFVVDHSFAPIEGKLAVYSRVGV